MSKFPEYPEIQHQACAGCKAFCCSRKFGFGNVALTQYDLRNKPLMDLLRKDKLLCKSHSDDSDVGMTMGSEENNDCHYLKDGRCSIYEIRPVACRAFFCTTNVSPLSQLTGRKENEDWVAYMEAEGFDMADHHAAFKKGDAPRAQALKRDQVTFGVLMRHRKASGRLKFENLLVRSSSGVIDGHIKKELLKQALDSKLIPALSVSVALLRKVHAGLFSLDARPGWRERMRKMHWMPKRSAGFNRRQRQNIVDGWYSNEWAMGRPIGRNVSYYVKRKGKKVWKTRDRYAYQELECVVASAEEKLTAVSLS